VVSGSGETRFGFVHESVGRHTPIQRSMAAGTLALCPTRPDPSFHAAAAAALHPSTPSHDHPNPSDTHPETGTRNTDVTCLAQSWFPPNA